MPDKLTLITDLQSLSYNDAIAFINDLPFAYYRADLDGRVLAAGTKAVQMLGYDRVEDIINVNLTDYHVAPDGRDKFMAALREGKGVIDNYEAEMRGPKGNLARALMGNITIALHREVDHLEIKVTDNGMGIPDDLRDTIMEPFVTTKKVGSGTGLGLSVSQGIVTAAGGTLQFLDVSDGACAQIILPLSTES